MDKRQLLILAALLPLQACTTAPYVPPSGPSAHLDISSTNAGIARKTAIGAYIYADGTCSSRMGTGDAKQVLIPAGHPIVIERFYDPGPIPVVTMRCYAAARFTPVEGETYESRLQVGIWECRALVLRVNENGRTENVKDLEKVSPPCTPDSR